MINQSVRDTQSWAKSECAILINEFKAGMLIDEMSKRHLRSKKIITRKLLEIGYNFECEELKSNLNMNKNDIYNNRAEPNSKTINRVYSRPIVQPAKTRDYSVDRFGVVTIR